MAGASLLTLIDDIATLLDDVAVMTKVAARKTAGVLGDDLALNAEQVSGVQPKRELPVVWAVAKGSAINKLILVPAALIISVVAPWAVTPLLMLGGAYLCFEGFEKIIRPFMHTAEEETEHVEKLKALSDPDVDLVKFENKKIKGAIRTDFILSAEIIVIALGSVKDASFLTQVIVVVSIAALVTIGVYGIVAGIVKMDDAGLHLIKSQAGNFWGRVKILTGNGLLWFAPILMKILSVVGAAAMFIVGGGILVHGLPGSHDFMHHSSELVQSVAVIGGLLSAITPTLLNALAGIVAGALLLIMFKLISIMVAVFKPAS